MHKRPHGRSALVLSVILVALGAALPRTAAAQGAEPGKQGTVKGDTGFRPKPNGFNFENWGGHERPLSDLTADDVRCLFGDAACERITGGHCAPSPAARVWIEEQNKGMEGGHCEGLAALSQAFQAGVRQPQAFGGQAAFDLKASDAALLRTISMLFVTQGLEPVQSKSAATRELSVRQIVDKLAQSLQPGQERLTLGIYGAEGGHAITPYALEDVGNGRYLIHVYDNNYAGVGNVVEVDANADHWSYAAAALNPGEAAAPWEGGGGSLDLTPLSVRFQPLVCPFCSAPTTTGMCAVGGAAGGPAAPPGRPATPPVPPQLSPRPSGGGAPAGPTSVITTANCDQVSIADKNGRRVSFAKGKMTSQIPGAVLTRRRGARGCSAQLPPGANYDMNVAGRPGQPPQALDTTIFRPGQVVSLDGGKVGPGQSDSVGFGDSSFSFKPGSNTKPTIVVATDNKDGKDGRFEIDELALGAGQTFSINEDPAGRLIFDSDDPNLNSFDVNATLEDEHGSENHDFDNVTFDEHGQGILAAGPDGGLMFGMDSDSDGIINARDPDDDNDGVPDAIDKDEDSDGDGKPDAQEPPRVHDSDGDGVPDAVDKDDDNDGILDAADKDENGDGLADAQQPEMHDTDHDGTPDAIDTDDDNDGIPDAVDKDENGDGKPDAQQPELHDTDHDGVPDAIDTDDDNDGILDAADKDENGDGKPDAQQPEMHDTDHDGTPDSFDADDDNDGTPDAIDKDENGDGKPDDQQPELHDTDHDGTPDAIDNDDDNDGTPDAQDEPAEEPAEDEDPPQG